MFYQDRITCYATQGWYEKITCKRPLCEQHTLKKVFNCRPTTNDTMNKRKKKT